MSRRDLVHEIEARRSRVADRLRHLGTHRMQALRGSAARLREADPDELRVFPVSGIAALEVFVRAAIAEMIDHSPQYLERLNGAGLLKDIKLDWTLLHAILGKRVTVGELVSHLLPFSSIGHIDAPLSALLHAPLEKGLGLAHYRMPGDNGVQRLPPIMNDVAQDRARVAESFTLRHQIVHEDYIPPSLDAARVTMLLGALDRFTQAVSVLIDDELYPNAPLTQSEMNQAAAESAQEAESKLENDWEQLTAVLGTDPNRVAARLKEAFHTYRSCRADLAAAAFEGGSMEPMIANAEWEATTREFVTVVARLRALHEPDGGALGAAG